MQSRGRGRGRGRGGRGRGGRGRGRGFSSFRRGKRKRFERGRGKGRRGTSGGRNFRLPSVPVVKKELVEELLKVTPSFEDDVTEESVGIKLFLNETPGFNATLKQRRSDFVVNEIDLDGNEVHLTSTDLPKLEKAEKKTDDTPGLEKLKKLVEEQTVSEFLKFVEEVKETKSKKEFFFQPESDKARRKEMHELIREHFDFLVSSFREKDGTKRIAVKLGKNVVRGWPKDTPEYLKFVLFKHGLSTMDAVIRLSDLLNRKSRAFGFAGTKDKRAVTSQNLTVYRLSPGRLISINKAMPNLMVGNIRYTDAALKLGSLKGNRFTLALRDITAPDEDVHKSMKSLEEHGFINYYGMQRFGTSVVPTHAIGIQILKEEWLKAVGLLLMPRRENDPRMREARKRLVEQYDLRAMYQACPRRFNPEKSVLVALMLGESHRNAITRISRPMLMMYIHAYQSYVWNNAVSYRIKQFGSDKPIIGDLVLDEDNTDEKKQADVSSRPKVVFVLGGPGAGKGTQCEKIVKDFGFAHLSAGDLLRAERATGSKNAELINNYINEGNIVPVEITVGLLKTAMEDHVTKGATNFLIDGFPRNQDNVEGWSRVVGDWATVAAVLYFDVPEDVMEKRMLGRGRGDDNIDTIRKRFATYLNSTKPIIDHYASKNLVKTVPGDKPVDEVYADVKKIIATILDEDVNVQEGKTPEKSQGEDEDGDGDTNMTNVHSESRDGKSTKKKVKVLTAENVNDYTIYDVVLPLPAKNITLPNNSVGTRYKEIMAEDEMTMDMFHSKDKALNQGGDYRHMLAKPKNMTWEIVYYDDHTVSLFPSDREILEGETPKINTSGKFKGCVVAFSLGTSSYATMCFREATRLSTAVSDMKENDRAYMAMQQSSTPTTTSPSQSSSSGSISQSVETKSSSETVEMDLSDVNEQRKRARSEQNDVDEQKPTKIQKSEAPKEQAVVGVEAGVIGKEEITQTEMCDVDSKDTEESSDLPQEGENK